MAAIYSRFHRRDFKIGLFGHITGSPYNRIQIDVEIFEKLPYRQWIQGDKNCEKLPCGILILPDEDYNEVQFSQTIVKQATLENQTTLCSWFASEHFSVDDILWISITPKVT